MSAPAEEPEPNLLGFIFNAVFQAVRGNEQLERMVRAIADEYNENMARINRHNVNAGAAGG